MDCGGRGARFGDAVGVVWEALPLGVTGNTPDSGSGESWFDPRRGNSSRTQLTARRGSFATGRFACPSDRPDRGRVPLGGHHMSAGQFTLTWCVEQSRAHIRLAQWEEQARSVKLSSKRVIDENLAMVSEVAESGELVRQAAASQSIDAGFTSRYVNRVSGGTKALREALPR